MQMFMYCGIEGSFGAGRALHVYVCVKYVGKQTNKLSGFRC